MAATKQTGVILVVEDPFICRLVRNVLRREGCEVVVAGPDEALQVFEDRRAPVSLVITNRPQAFTCLEHMAPILYLASTPDWDLAARTAGMRVLLKPFHAKELVEAVAEIIGQT